MDPTALLLALQLFNASVVRNLASVKDAPRVFVGAQLNEDTAAISWTKCVPESGVFVVQISERALGLDPSVVRHAAAHEVCHVLLHAKTLCGQEYGELPMLTRQLMERAADVCAKDMLSRAK